jgi:hypothetical protein
MGTYSDVFKQRVARARESGRVSIYPQGSIIEHPMVQFTGGGGVRGVISGFSKASRRRLQNKLLRLDMARDWDFLALTYPGEYVVDAKRWHMDLEAFYAALRRKYSSEYGGAIWRLEQQARGAPHFHLLIHWADGDVNLSECRKWVRETWTRIIGKPENANYVRTHVQHVVIQPDGGVVKLLHYLLKYLGKIDKNGWIDHETGEIIETGRVWGEWGKLPYAEPIVVEVEGEKWVKLARRIRRWGKRSPYLRSMTVDRLRGVLYGSEGTLSELLRDL